MVEQKLTFCYESLKRSFYPAHFQLNNLLNVSIDNHQVMIF